MIDKFIQLLNTVLASKTGLLLALIIPLVVIPMPDQIKQVENILSSNWIQLWALFVLAIIAKQGNDKHAEHAKKLEAIHKHLGIDNGRRN